jgi:hypothetical protein
MKNNPLQRAVITSLVQKSLLLTKEKKAVLLKKLPKMTDAHLEELQQLIGNEENVLLHPKDLGLEEVLATADDTARTEMNILIDSSVRELQRAEKTAGEDQDAADADTLLKTLT